MNNQGKNKVSRIGFHFLPYTGTLVKSLQNYVQDLENSSQQFNNFKNIPLGRKFWGFAYIF